MKINKDNKETIVMIVILLVLTILVLFIISSRGDAVEQRYIEKKETLIEKDYSELGFFDKIEKWLLFRDSSKELNNSCPK